MRFFAFTISYAFFTLCIPSASFAGTWYANAGGGFGGQAKYNFSIEKERYQLKIKQEVQKASAVAPPLKRDHVIELKKQKAWSKSEVTEIFKHGAVSRLPDGEFYALIGRITPHKESLNILNHQISKLERNQTQFLLAAGRATLGYQIGSMAVEGGALFLKSKMAICNTYDDPKTYQELFNISDPIKYTTLHGGIVSYKRFTALSFGIKVYMEGGLAILKGVNDSLLPAINQKSSEKISLPWRITFTQGFGAQYNLSTRWMLVGSWMTIMERHCIPRCTLLTVGACYRISN